MNFKLLTTYLLDSAKRLASTFLLLLTVSFILFAGPQTISAASGGRIGGGNFSSRPSMPQPRAYQRDFQFNSGGYRGGIGLPFILPFYGFGGGLFGFLIFITISGIITNALRKGIQSPIKKSYVELPEDSKTYALSQIQIGLLGTGKDIQVSLKKLAEESDTSNSEGLQNVLQESIITLLRNPDLWVYGNTEYGNVPINAIEKTFNRISISERSKLKKESIVNFSGETENFESSFKEEESLDQINEFIVVSLLIASKKNLSIKEITSIQELEENLKTIGSIPSSDLLALEIIWQPEGIKEVLRKEELLISYPNMKHL